ncbi:unnamed protein product [Ranitomeya imitator]|uniref:Ig-like domain-containing protein n=1 Tax=Ranitomeya imitator TaxID=111125 RepID=A0ABN9KR14_9NEOB|nr:unnamed protein product [Ranitomeya imitator]
MQVLNSWCKDDSEKGQESAQNYMEEFVNDLKRAVTTVSNITVIPPSIKDGPKLVTTFTNKPATLDCIATGIPSPRISWRKDGAILDGNSERCFILGSGSLNFLLTDIKDSGHYVCLATNAAGSSQRKTELLVLGNFLAFGKMGQKRDLTGSEKSKIVSCLAEGCSRVEIAKYLNCDHRTIKLSMANSQQGRKKRVGQKRRKITAHELRKIKGEAAKMPLATSFAIFLSCNVTGVSKSTRCAILRDMAKVLWTDEMRVTLHGPDGWARGWISKGQRAPLRRRRQQGGGGVLVWAGIKDELVGPFRVEDGVKLNSQTYCQFTASGTGRSRYRSRKTSFSCRTMLHLMHPTTPQRGWPVKVSKKKTK